MYFNNRNRPQTSVYGCSSSSLLIFLIILSFMIFGGLFFILRYLGLIIALAFVVWIFRKFFKMTNEESKSRDQTKRGSWSRDFEQKKETPYDNIEREFEEVDDDKDLNDF